jgi:phytoene synthase
MSPPPLSAPAELVRTHDPDLFHAALFAPEPARERLMVLYAYDIELSRAAARTSEPLIARMRLQWWRDLVTGIASGEPARAHEVAGPLHALLNAHALPPADIAALADARELELHGSMDEHHFNDWLDARFGALVRLAAYLLSGDDAATRRSASAVGHAMGVAFALRHAVAMAAANQFLLPTLGAEDRAALSRGQTTAHARATAYRLAEHSLALLSAARAGRRSVPKSALPALLPVWRAERVLRQVRRPGFEFSALQPGGHRAATLAWRALRGRW